jgi:hypothetical protein
MIKRLYILKNTVNMADIRPGRLTTCQSERKSVVKSMTKCNYRRRMAEMCGGTELRRARLLFNGTPCD